jgi:purine-binding chemotaxis protein CheW
MSETTHKAPAGKYLTFALAHEEYGVPVLKVREIIKMMDITAVPQVPAHVKGVNLRGKVIPIVDLRLKFGVPSDVYTDRTCIIVSEVERAGLRTLLGMVVDSVCEVLSISGDDIEAMPEMGGSVDTGYMHGIAKVKGTVKLLLDLDKLLSAESLLARAAA